VVAAWLQIHDPSLYREAVSNRCIVFGTIIQSWHTKQLPKTAAGAASMTGYDTFALKEAIKQCGGRWEAATKIWIVPPPCDLAPLEEEMRLLAETRKAEAKAERERRKAERAFVATPEGQPEAAAKETARAIRSAVLYWSCHCRLTSSVPSAA